MAIPDLLDTAFLSEDEQRAVALFRRQGRLPDPSWEAPIASARARYDVGGVDDLTDLDNQYILNFHSIMHLGVFDGLDISLSR